MTLPFLVIDSCSVYVPAMTWMVFAAESLGRAAIAALMLAYWQVLGVRDTTRVAPGVQAADVEVEDATVEVLLTDEVTVDVRLAERAADVVVAAAELVAATTDDELDVELVVDEGREVIVEHGLEVDTTLPKVSGGSTKQLRAHFTPCRHRRHIHGKLSNHHHLQHHHSGYS